MIRTQTKLWRDSSAIEHKVSRGRTMNQLLHSQNSIYWHICGSDKTRPSFFSPAFTNIKPRANGRNFVPQQLPTLLDVTCCVRLHTLLHVVAQSLKAVKLLHGSSNIVGATHALYTWSPWRLQSLTGFILPTMHCRS